MSCISQNALSGGGDVSCLEVCCTDGCSVSADAMSTCCSISTGVTVVELSNPSSDCELSLKMAAKVGPLDDEIS